MAEHGVSRRTFLAGATAGVLAAGSGAVPALAAPTTGGPGGPGQVGPYLPTKESLAQHATPQWFTRGKFGIFIHWGVYAVPGWGDAAPYHGAEWYMYAMNIKGAGVDATHQHHLNTYGADFDYDDFIPMFTARRYDPHAWVRLFERAGARYFVLTSKHHDGFALFPNRVSNRNSVAMGPRRDLVGELFAAAEHSSLKRGLYHSLGEFYSPALGTPPKNPYTGQPIVYTGYKPVNDYVADYEHVQLRTLIDRYDPDLLWADGQNYHEDLGGGQAFCPKDWNWRSDEILAYYYNHAVNRRHPVEVGVNNRFRASHADFSVSEGDKSSYSLRSTPWEACLTLGRSWGYDSNENPAIIKSGTRCVRLLVDIVSKNGNLLLNVGPQADGTIPDWQAQRLEQVGKWLASNGSSIYDTTPWTRAEDGQLRYTVSDKAFHVISMSWPGSTLTAPADIPIASDSQVRLLGHRGRPLDWTRTDSGVQITMPSSGTPNGDESYPCVVAIRHTR